MNINSKIRCGEAQSSAEFIASIDELLTMILLLLPIKSLIRFKLVSKQWYSLITNPQFCILRNPSPNPAVGLFLHHIDNSNLGIRISPKFEYVSFSPNQSSNPPFRTLNFTKDPSGIGILQSCNGLLLCSSYNPQCYDTRYYVYNPTIKRFRKLPKIETIPNSTTIIRGMSLAFDPAKSPHYKVVCVRGLKSNYKYQIEVYSSETGSWRTRGEPFTDELTSFEKGVYWNGAIHWVNEFSDSLYFNLHDDDEKKPKVLALPSIPDGWEWRNNYYLGESCGHLHYIELLGPLIKFNVHEMKMDHSEWFVKYSFDLSSVVATYPLVDRNNYDPMDWHLYGFSVFSVVRGEREEDSFLVLQIPGRVLRYSLVCGSFVTIHEFEDGDENEGLLKYPTTNGFQYIESLSCV